MDTIYVSLFGELSIRYKDNVITENTVLSKKSWILLSYLIVNRNREIPQTELFDVLWQEEKSENPVNALKTLLHRTRNILGKLEIENYEKLIKCSRGSYGWNTEFEIEVDCEMFESEYKKLVNSRSTHEEKVCAGMLAVELYKGTFITKYSSEYWVIPLYTYYNQLHSEIVNRTVALLDKNEDYAMISHICKNSIIINPYEESFYYQMINALYNEGNVSGAIEQYKKVEKFFYLNFGQSLSERFSELYSKIFNANNKKQVDIKKVSNSLEESEESNGAFYCEFEFFKQRYQVESRLSKRKKNPLYVILISLDGKKAEFDQAESLEPVMLNVEDILKKSLRSSDVFARYSVSQCIVMLSDTTMDNACAVTERIMKNCKRAIARKGYVIRCDMKSNDEEIQSFM